jgi:predicted unusual protein kinase regulating ubiquinone biosynthesis (AarF/ABC1/UbiB family)
MQARLTLASSSFERIRGVVTILATAIGRQARATFDGEAQPAEALADTLESLGVTFVKLGQTLSTRPDLLPESYIEALKRLRDDVQPMSPEEVEKQLATRETGFWLRTAFSHFDPVPLGSGSIGQVHEATLADGRPVAVKIQRPEARDRVEEDLRILRLAVGQLDLVTDSRALLQLLDTFETALLLELDYRVEARNLRRMGAALADEPRLTVPAPLERFSTERVLVMERVDGVPLHAATDIPQPTDLAEAVVRTYLRQILEEGFLHADPHPGNLLVDRLGTLHLIDLGMVDELGPVEREQIAALILGITLNAPRDATRALQALCAPTADADGDGLRATVAHTLRRANALRGIRPTFGETLTDMLRAVSTHGYEVPMRLATLTRALSMLDEVLTLLDPTFDPGVVVERDSGTYLWGQLVSQMGGMGVVHNGLAVSRFLRRGPTQVNRLLEQLGSGDFTVTVDAIDEERTLEAIRRIANRIAGAVLVAALLISGAMLQNTGRELVFGMSTLSTAFLVLGGMGAATLLFSILWYDR